MDRTPGVAAAPATVRLHPSRKVGACYAALAGVVLAIAVVAAANYLRDGRFVMALIIAVGAVAVDAFLTVVALALLIPCLDVSEAGATGRLTTRRRVDVSWDSITVDVPENAPPGRLRLDVAADSVEVDARSWAGFPAFALLLASTPGPARRLTPAARREVARFLGLERG